MSPGRSGFGPQLALSYDSGGGNGPFGLGWSLSLPSITRKTDKGLPRYQDEEDSDVFLLSGAEDLVPVLDEDGRRFEDRTTAPEYTIHRFRPRIEGLFARIERWTHSTGVVHWRSITNDNVLTVYGLTNESRISDPADDHRIFSWLICQTRDDNGNVVIYRYRSENGDDAPLWQPHQVNRGERSDTGRTANRYLKRIHYGNRSPLLDESGHRPPHLSQAQLDSVDWMFEVVFDYDEDHVAGGSTDSEGRRFVIANVEPSTPWSYRADAFSSYRAGFDLRTARLCSRVLMFHHFPGEPDVGRGCLVRSTDFAYTRESDPAGAPSPSYTYLTAVRHCGYRRSGHRYLQQELPALEFTYTLPRVAGTVEDIDAESLRNLPGGPDGSGFQWVDLHAEGTPGLLTEQAGAWIYKRNISPLTESAVKLGPIEVVSTKPNVGLREAQLMDLAGDGSVDVVVLDGPVSGFYEHDTGEGWDSFRTFASHLNRQLRRPDVRFVDLDGDGVPDILVTEDSSFVWYRSLGEKGFRPSGRAPQALDEERGPRVAFADDTESIHVADLSGDGLGDLVRIRNGEVCYWPNLGHGRFGAKVTMDASPYFDNPDQFRPDRLRLADIDGSGTTDLIYLHRDGVRLYFNQSGNGWSRPHVLDVFPRVDDLSAIAPADLLGNGTACLVWSSTAPGDAGRPMRYVRLMGADKPHLLVGTDNNLGARTRVRYVPSTFFYLRDKRDANPWITRLPFPVHVVERVETYDKVSRNRFVTRYAYHHGYFDGEEREFRGFGMVEQWDTEELDAPALDDAANLDKASWVPPVLTRTWFHTGIHAGGDRVSTYFAAAAGNLAGNGYYHDPEEPMLPDTVLPDGLPRDEEREACRALKGAMLRQEVYGLDGTPAEVHPYVVTEQNFTVRRLQQRGRNRYGVFLTSPRESLRYHYEREPSDPRTTHALTLDVDDYGNVRKSLVVGYGRRPGRSPLTGEDKQKQERLLITYTESDYTQPEGAAAAWAGAYRTPLLSETRTFEVTGLTPTAGTARFTFGELADNGSAALTGLTSVPYESPAGATSKGRRLIENSRTRYRRDDLTDLLPLGRHGVLGLPGESYRLAFTPGLIDRVYRRDSETLLPTPADVLSGGGADRGGYVDLDGDGRWWAPSGRVFYSPAAEDDTAAELAFARGHFFLPHRHRDPFGESIAVSHDGDHLLPVRTQDALGNVVAAAYDYRVLQPRQITDANGNRSEAAFDALGMVIATAVRGKVAPAPVEGDSFDLFTVDLSPQQIATYFAAGDPRPLAVTHLGTATTRVIYNLDTVPASAASILRETHESDLGDDQRSKVHLSFSYSDGFGREVQKKMRAEPGPVPRRDETGRIVVGADGLPELVDGGGSPRWVGSGWTIFNNKGKPVRQFEPFFSDTHALDADVHLGVSPWLCYDPAERVVATLHPNRTYEKVVFDPWRHATYDVSDTVMLADGSTNPLADADVAGFFERLPEAEYSPTWYEQRTALATADPERVAAEKTAVHRQTPTVAHLDALGRPFLTVAHNRFLRAGAPVEELYPSRVELDIEGNERSVRDAVVQGGDGSGRLVMRYDYDLLGNRIGQASMEAGQRWALADVSGKPIRQWDSRGFLRRTTYDSLRRPTGLYVTEEGTERLAERTLYGEGQGANFRTRVYQTYDGAGVLTNAGFDFKGNTLHVRRDLLPNYRAAVDWKANPVANDGTFLTATTYDALNRVRTVTVPDGSISRPEYNQANLLERVDVALGGGPTWTAIVTGVDYDAKGQRHQITYGNGATTTYLYDRRTFRLTQLRTTRPAQPDATASRLFADATVVQDLLYTYDAVGNLARIADTALRTVISGNAKIEPVSTYTYDATYRLIEATGREHVGQTAHIPSPSSSRRDHDFAGLANLVAHPNDLEVLRTYTERYEYDPAGNLQTMRHVATAGNWTRAYEYTAASLLEPAMQSNRLTRTTVGNGAAYTETYGYTDAQGRDVSGCMTSINSLGLAWDHREQLRQVNLGGGGTVHYVYDAGGHRVRKVIDDQNGQRREERVYVGAYEVFRSFGVIALTRETLHLMDDKRRVAVVETKVAPEREQPVLRFQLANHLGSAALELDHAGDLVTFEEYHPYGTSSMQAGRSGAEVSLKRYRHAAKERDEETGFSYHGARFRAPWLGRWVSCDPSGLIDRLSLYAFANDNPVGNFDPDGREGFWHNSWEAVKGVGDGVGNIASGVGHMIAHPVNTVSAVGAAMRESYLREGGGGWGVLAAANELNPAYHAMVAGYETLQAVERGDYRAAGREGFNTVFQTASTAAVAVGGAGLVSRGLGVGSRAAAGAASSVAGESAGALRAASMSARAATTAETAAAATRTAPRILRTGVSSDLIPITEIPANSAARGAIFTVTGDAVENSVTLGYIHRGAGTMGHNVVGLTSEGTTSWFHLAAPKGGSGLFRMANPISEPMLLTTMDATPQAVARAMSAANGGLGLGAAEWSVLGPNCATTAGALLQEAGIAVPLWAKTPALLHVGVRYGTAISSAGLVTAGESLPIAQRVGSTPERQNP